LLTSPITIGRLLVNQCLKRQHWPIGVLVWVAKIGKG